MTFESLSQSPWILPGLAWLALPIVLAFALRRRGFFRVWGVVFGVLIALDAWLGGALSPIPPGSSWAVASGVTFVILGDLRFFLVAEWGDGARATPRALARAVGLSFVVPVTSQIVRASSPSIAAAPRLTYLVYELLFLVFLGVWYVFRARRSSPARRALVLRMSRFVAAEYGLWACADVLILATSADVGFGLRLVPDVLYYVVFVPWILVLSLRAPSPSSSRRASSR